METTCFAFSWSSTQMKQTFFFSSKATGGRKDCNNVIWHVQQWLAVHSHKCSLEHDFWRKAAGLFSKSGSCCSSHLYWASRTMSTEINSLSSALSRAEVIALFSNPVQSDWLTVRLQVLKNVNFDYYKWKWMRRNDGSSLSLRQHHET